MSIAPIAAQRPAPRLEFRERFGWRRLRHGAVDLWFKGYLYGREAEGLARGLGAWAARPDSDDLAAWLLGLDGHFAIAATAPGWTLAAVDRVRSIPLFYGRDGGAYVISSNAPGLCRSLGLGLADIDSDAALALAMAGYTIGTDTLYRGLEQLGPGQFLLIDADGKALCRRYHRYEPWRVTETDGPALKDRLAGVTLGILRKVIESAAGRTILVPLSAGLDSRLVVSGLANLGYRNVKCFAYGLLGNHEAEASRRIAAHLGFDWRFVRFTLKQQRAYFLSALHRDYLAFADSCCSCPFAQDLPAVHALSAQGYIPDDAILVNGNSGDFISGNHILSPLHRPRPDLDASARRALILRALIGRHFRLWEGLGTPENDERIRSRLLQELARHGLDAGDPETAHGIYEFLEFQDRQCKYVITGQRIYEFLGLDWRLPLWDGEYLDFWQGVPLSAKVEQRLYRATLAERNWGGVWRGRAWIFPRRVSPRWMRHGLRPLFKALHAPLGRRRWHRFERQYLQYWMDLLCNSAIVPYGRVFRDRRGARHFVSWHTEVYLRDKGLGFDGRPLCGPEDGGR